MHPNLDLVQDIRNQGEIVTHIRSNGNNNFPQNPVSANGSQQAQASAPQMVSHRSQTRASSSPSNGDQLLCWDSNNEATNGVSSTVTAAKTYASIVKPSTVQTTGQCIPGSNSHISVKPSLAPSMQYNKSLYIIQIFIYKIIYFTALSFCFDGSGDGQVSRPWGVCVTKNNEVIIADRRNNRIQVFFSDGTFKFKFGSKGMMVY